MSRRRYVQIDGKLIEVGLGFQQAGRDSPYIAGDRHYDGLRSPIDGEDISTRTKHREYMRRHGLTTIDDYVGSWADAAKRRADYYEGRDPKRRKDIEKAIQTLKNRKKPT